MFIPSILHRQYCKMLKSKVVISNEQRQERVF